MHKLDRLTFSLTLFLGASAAGVACGGAPVETGSSSGSDSGSGAGSGAGFSSSSGSGSSSGPDTLTGWWRHVGGPDSDDLHDVAVAPDGDVIVAGAFRGTVDFGNGPITAAILEDAFVARYAPDGVLRWVSHIGSSVHPSDNVRATGVAVDGNGNVLLTGLFEGTVDAGTGALVSAGADDIFVVCYAPDGKPTWSRRIGGASFERVGKIAADAGGNALLAGTQAGKLFVAKLGAAGGEELWFHELGSVQNGLSDLPPIDDVATDPAGDLYITGSFYGSANLGGATLKSIGGTDIFVARYRGSDGAHMWSDRHGGAADPIARGDEAFSLAVDDNSVVICGLGWGPVDLGGGVLEAPTGTRTAFLARYETSGGGHVWSQRLDSHWASRVALSGDAVLVFGMVAYDDPATGLLGRFALADGAATGQQAMPGPGSIELAVAGDGHLVMAINFSGQVTVGAEDFTAVGGDDLLIGPFLMPSAEP